VKSMVAYLEDDEAYARVMPPFLTLAETDRLLLIQRYQCGRGRRFRGDEYGSLIMAYIIPEPPPRDDPG